MHRCARECSARLVGHTPVLQCGILPPALIASRLLLLLSLLAKAALLLTHVLGLFYSGTILIGRVHTNTLAPEARASLRISCTFAQVWVVSAVPVSAIPQGDGQPAM